MIHSKVSGVANTGPSVVGGGDWDAPHVHAPGEVWTIAFQAFEFNPTGNAVISWNSAGRVVGNVIRQSAGVYYFDLNLASLPIVSTGWSDFVVHLSVLPRGSITTGWRFESQAGDEPTPGTGRCYIRVFNASNAPADLTIKADFNVTVLCFVPV